jgi:DUF1680 family protein
MKNKRSFNIILLSILICFGHYLIAQQNSLVNTTESPYAKLNSVDFTDVTLTEGFWGEQLAVCKQTMVPHMMGCYMNDTLSHGFANFEIAAGLKEGEHEGPPFHDGDFYKILEGLIAIHALTQDTETDRQLDSIISIIGKTQRADGYIHTPVVIEQLKNIEKKKEFAERLDFETYNMGHLMTAACLHHRVTGKTNLLNIAIKATDFLYGFYKRNAAALAKNAICPSHYMGVAEMFRTTHDPRYLELAKALIDIRSMVEDGTDHNQDRIPFRQQTKAQGHAVRANYLYAGATDVYLETGDDSLMASLDAIWHDLTEKKLYITGACGALYDGVSPNGTSYKPSYIQQVHQAYGQDYELPNLTAHNESCANIGNILWNWRMLLATADASYADIMEMVMYNSLLAGVNLDGRGYFYTNPLAVSQDLTYELRWSKEREEYINYCNCCPPNTIRTIAEIQNYFYSISDEGLWIHLYGGNTLTTELEDGSEIQLIQATNYPWDGKIRIKIEKAPEKEISVNLRIPAWSRKAMVFINGEEYQSDLVPGTYVRIKRLWNSNDVINLELPMEAKLIEANSLVEETRNQVTVKRGPVVYCLESVDLPENCSVFDIEIPVNVKFYPQQEKIGESIITSLYGNVLQIKSDDWEGQLYREISQQNEEIKIKLIPYYAWGNRGKTDMTVWLPLNR